MASYNELNALIDAYINRNGVQAITGQILNGVLKAMVEQLGRGYTIMGAATPTTDPGTPDGPESWFASTPGTYTNMGGLTVANAELALLSYTPSDGWAKTTLTQGITEVQATIDANVGIPEVSADYVNGVLYFDFKNLKGTQGVQGPTGPAAGFGIPTATVDGNVGTPGVSVSASGPDTAKVFSFAFTNLKGDQGDQGIQGPEGPEGPTGPAGVTSVVATVDNTTGNPTCTVSLNAGVLTLAFTGLKGAQGDTGSSVAYPFTIVNNLTTNDATQALSAAMGVQLEGEITQLELKVDENAGYVLNSFFVGNAQTFSYKSIFGLVIGRKYRIVLKSTTWDTTGITGSTTYKLVIRKSYNGTTSNLVTVRLDADVAPYYDITIPSNTDYIDVGGRAATSVQVGFNIFDITDVSKLLDGRNEILRVTDIFGNLYHDFNPVILTGKLVSSTTGDYSDNATCNAVSIDLVGVPYTKMTFKITNFGGNFGYGFFVNGVWQGVHTVNNAEITVDIPEGATEFRGCWNTSTYATNKYIGTCKNEQVDADTLYQLSRLGNIDEKFDVNEVIGTPVEFGTVSSATGAYGDSTTVLRTTIDLTGAKFKKLGFKTTLFSGNFGYGFFLSDQTWQGIKTTSAATVLIDVPDNAVEFRLCWNKSALADNPVTAYYVSTLAYEHKLQITNADEARERLAKVEPITEYVDINLKNQLKPFVLPVPDGDGVGGNVDISNLSVSTMYNLWDGLVAEYPDFLSSSEIGDDASGQYKLREIVFRCTLSPIGNPARNVIVLANLHGPGTGGDTRMQAYLVYYFIKWILDNKETNADAQWFLMNYAFIIFPIGNPWGYDNASRYNYNDVDLNRNFNASWESGGHNGASAASEPETQLLQTRISHYAESNTYYGRIKTYLFIDFHSHLEGNSLLQYLPNTTNLANDLSVLCHRYWKQVSKGQTLGITVESVGGMAKKYAEEKVGIPGLVIEGAPYDLIESKNYTARAMTNTMRLFVALLRIG